MAPAEQKERSIAALIGLYEGLAREAPVLAILEDAHWIDPTSLEVFTRLIELAPRLRTLIVVSFRPDFAPPWTGRAHLELLSLGRLGRRHAVELIDRVAGGKALPAEVLDQIVAKTDGVPLFIEELTKTVLEFGLLREEGGAYVLASRLTPLAIPSTLEDLLMARLDRLAPVKDVAQIGAAIGREFSFRLLEVRSADQRGGPGGGASAVGGGRARVHARRAARGDLRFRTCARPGRGLPEPPQEPSAGPSPADRRESVQRVSRSR